MAHVQDPPSSLWSSAYDNFLNAKSIRTAIRYDDGSLSSYWRGITNLLDENNEITVAYAVPDKKLSIIYSDENGTLRTAKFTPESDLPLNP